MGNNNVKMSKGVVVFLDRLGTKGIYDKDDLSKIVQEYHAFRNEIDCYIDQFQKIHESAGRDSGVSFKANVNYVSDTIIITSEPICDNEVMKEYSLLNLLIVSIEYAVCKIIYSGLSRNWLFRGVISYGDYYVEDNLLIGKAIDEAALWYEKSDWIGCHLAPSASLVVETLGNPNTYANFHIKYPIPFKDNSYKFNYLYAINFISWFNLHGHIMANAGIDTLPKFREALTDLFCKQPTNTDVYRKLDNTLRFFDVMVKDITDKKNDS